MTGHELVFDTDDSGSWAWCSCGWKELHFGEQVAHQAGARHLAGECMAGLRSIDERLRALVDQQAEARVERQVVLDELRAVFGVAGVAVRLGAQR